MDLQRFLRIAKNDVKTIKTKNKNPKPKEKLALFKKKNSSTIIKLNINTKGQLRKIGISPYKQKSPLVNFRTAGRNRISNDFFLIKKQSESVKNINGKKLLTKKKKSIKERSVDGKKRKTLLISKSSKSKLKEKERSSIKKTMTNKTKGFRGYSPLTNQSCKTRSYSKKAKDSYRISLKSKTKTNKDLVSPKLRQKLEGLEQKLKNILQDNLKSMKQLDIQKL